MGRTDSGSTQPEFVNSSSGLHGEIDSGAVRPVAGRTFSPNDKPPTYWAVGETGSSAPYVCTSVGSNGPGAPLDNSGRWA